jgi:putative membrane protein
MDGRKILIVAVDYDDDVSKAGVKTPLLGYPEVLDAALKFGTYFPDDSDLNVLFHALYLHNDLKSRGYEVEVAVISGHPESHVEAGRRLIEQINYVSSTAKCSDVVLVLDSVEDELVIPVIQGRVNIISVERVVVEQLRGVEETYVLLGKYIRKALEEPRFSRVFLGLPGFLLLLYVLISVTPYYIHAWEVTLAALGVFLIVKGFHIPEAILRRWRSSSIYRVTGVLSLISIAAGVAFTIGAVVSRDFSVDPRSLSTYIKTALPFVSLALAVLYSGRLATKVLRRSIRVWRDVVAISAVVLIATYISNLANTISTYPSLDVLVILYDLQVVNTFAILMLTLVIVYVIMSYVERQVLAQTRRS